MLYILRTWKKEKVQKWNTNSFEWKYGKSLLGIHRRKGSPGGPPGVSGADIGHPDFGGHRWPVPGSRKAAQPVESQLPSPFLSWRDCCQGPEMLIYSLQICGVRSSRKLNPSDTIMSASVALCSCGEWPVAPMLLLFIYLFIYFNCSEFCHTLKWNIHGFTCVPHPDPPSHLPLHPLPLGLPSAPGPSACLMHATWACDLFHLDNIHVSMLFSWNIPHSPSSTESKRLFYKSVSFFFLFCI